MAVCGKCKKNVSRIFLPENDNRWLCEDCYPMWVANRAFSKIEKIKSRVTTPDGKVIQGREAQKIVDQRLRAQRSA